MLLLACGWLGHRGLQAQRHLEAARVSLAGLAPEQDRDEQSARLQEAAADTAAARAAARDPLWSLVARVPGVGAPLRTAAGLTEVTDGLVQDTLPALVAASRGLDQVRGTAAAGVPLAELTALAAPLTAADQDLAQARYALEQLPSRPRVAPLERARAELLAQVGRLDGGVRAAAAAARTAPGMLGADGPRRYLVVFHNRAELRPDGGLLGGFAEVLVTGGRLEVVQLGQNSDLPRLAATPGSVDPVFLATYGNRGAGENWVNTNLSPHFPDNAQALAAMYAAGTGRAVDGVLALDAVALGELAGLSGRPLVVPGTPPVPPSQVADFLERGQYALGLQRDERKDLVAEVGRQALQRLQQAPVGGSDLLRRLGHLAADGHLKLASTRPQEQQELLRFAVAGAAGGTSPYAGVFVSNAAGSKLDPYLQERVTYACRVQGQALLTVRLRNDAPADLPPYVTLRADDPPQPVPPGQNRVGLTLVGDRGAGLGAVTLDGEPLSGLEPLEVAGHSAWRVFLELPPGRERTLQMVLQGQGSQGSPRVQVQPLVRLPVVEVDPACS